MFAVAKGLRAIAIASFASLAFMAGGGEARAQCAGLDVVETFRLGPRPHGGNGNLRDAQVHDTLRGYWPQFPTGAQWSTPDQTGVASWIFAASSTDPVELDPLDMYNGAAFGDAEAVAVLPLTLPVTAFTISAEMVMPYGLPGSVSIGFGPSQVLASNLPSTGALWLSLDGLGNWQMCANGSTTIVASGTTTQGLLNSGWTHVEFTFDPATSMVSGKIGRASFDSTPVQVQSNMSFLVMETHLYWGVVNNLRVVDGARLFISLPSEMNTCANSTFSINAATNAAAELSAGYAWTHDGAVMLDGTSNLGTVLGATTATLSIANASPEMAGTFECVVFNVCGMATSNPMTLSIWSGGTGDGDGNGVTDGADIQGFVNALLNIGTPAQLACIFDMNASGVIDADDVLAFIDILLVP